MRPRFSFLLASFGLLIACDGIEPIEVQTQPMETHSRWATELLKTEYSIQFPGNYTGGWRGNEVSHTYYKFRADEKIVFRYANCGIVSCGDFFGTTPISETILADGPNGRTVTLGHRVPFASQGDQTQGYFYYNDAEMATGLFVMKRKDIDDQEYYRFVTVDFPLTELREVFNIIRTIQYTP